MRLLCLLNHWPWRKVQLIWCGINRREYTYRCRLCGERFKVQTGGNGKMDGKVRFFVEVEGGEGAMYCGDADNIPDAMKGIGNLLEPYLQELAIYPDELSEIYLTAKRMTDEEVAALPEL